MDIYTISSIMRCIKLKAVIITNNRLVWEHYKGIFDVKLLDGGIMEVLLYLRDRIHEGHELLTHPLSGSVKPNETPYKSAMLSSSKGLLNMSSLMTIEASIETTNKFLNIRRHETWTQNVIEDFQVIDKTLIDSAVESMRLNKSL
jgi:hypothetical protein